MSRKGSQRRRQQRASKLQGNGALLLKPPPLPPGPVPTPGRSAAVPLSRRHEALVEQTPRDNTEALAPLPRNRALVDTNQPMLRRLRFWVLDIAERWVTRNRPLPEQPTLAQLNRLRSELASVQRRLDRMLG